MRWDEQDQAWYGVTSTGKTICVTRSAYQQAVQDEVWPSVLQDPDAWEMLIGHVAGISYYDE